MRTQLFAAALLLVGLPMSLPVIAQSGENQGQGQAIVTIVPKHENEAAPNVTQQDLQSVKVNGKDAKVTSWQSLRGAQDKVELVILIDDAARASLGRQIEDIGAFVRSLPPNIAAGIAYMENGRAVFSGPLSTDHEQILRALHLPAGIAGVDSSPYFCLSDLAKNWPSQDRGSRREVVMVTDGIDYYYRRFDPDDPYVQAAITDSVRAGLVVYSIYWENVGRIDRSIWGNNAGQSLLTEVDEATGGRNFWQGFGNPVSFQPYFEDLSRRLKNQYEVGFNAPLKGKPEVETFKLKLMAPGAEVDSPQQVLVMPGATAEK
jgi:hypothetical protein